MAFGIKPDNWAQNSVQCGACIVALCTIYALLHVSKVHIHRASCEYTCAICTVRMRASCVHTRMARAHKQHRRVVPFARAPVSARLVAMSKQHAASSGPPLAHIGTSSWQFEGWRNVFYPDKTPVKSYLAYYVTQFDSVEVNTSFYALPRASTVVDWVETAPEGFTFALKAPRAITHEKKLQGAEAESLAFVDVLRSLGAAAAPALLQLPPDFSRRHGGRALASYLEWLVPRLEGVRLAVEVRAVDLMTEAFAEYLAKLGLSLVLVVRAGTPDLFPAWLTQVEAGRAPGFCFIRWIGDDRNGPKGDAEIVLRRDAEMAQWAERITQLTGAGQEVYGYMHNPYEGHAPASAKRLRELLGNSAAPPPGSGQLALL